MDSWCWNLKKSKASKKNVTVRFTRFVEEWPYDVDAADQVLPVFNSSVAIPSTAASKTLIGSEKFYEYPVTLWPKFVITFNRFLWHYKDRFPDTLLWASTVEWHWVPHPNDPHGTPANNPVVMLRDTYGNECVLSIDSHLERVMYRVTNGNKSTVVVWVQGNENEFQAGLFKVTLPNGQLSPVLLKPNDTHYDFAMEWLRPGLDHETPLPLLCCRTVTSMYMDVDVPGDGTCLYYAYLLGSDLVDNDRNALQILHTSVKEPSSAVEMIRTKYYHRALDLRKKVARVIRAL